MKSLKVLKSKLSEDDILRYENVHGVIEEAAFKWNPPATNNQIIQFEKKYSIKLPESFYRFLKISNGAELFKEVEYLGWGCKIFGLDDIVEITEERRRWGYQIKDDWIVFGEWFDNGDLLIFDIGSLRVGRSYIVDGNIGYPVENWRYISSDFEIWMNRLILVHGDKYWRW